MRWSARPARARADDRAAGGDPARAQPRRGHPPSSPACSSCAAEVFDTLDYDTVVVLDSHWATTVEFVVTAQERRAGLFTVRGAAARDVPQRPYDFARRPRAGPRDRRRTATSTAPGSPRSTTTTCRSSTRPPTCGSSSARGCRTSAGSRSASARPPTSRTTCGSAGRSATRSPSRPQGGADRLRRAVPHLLAAAPAARPRGARASSTSSPRRRRPPTASGSSGSARRPRAGARHDAGVLPVQARGAVRPLPDDDRRARRGRLHGHRPASTASTRTRSAPARCTCGSTVPRPGSPRPGGPPRTRLRPPERRPRPDRGRLTPPMSETHVTEYRRILLDGNAVDVVRHGDAPGRRRRPGGRQSTTPSTCRRSSRPRSSPCT